jgi:surface polysaccharide O-acyltransferase-like enzyme
VIENKKENKKIDFISFSSLFAAICVVFLHVNGCFWNFDSTQGYWFSANVIECTAYFAVPVFFMISGSTLLDFFNRYGIREYCRKRIVRVLIPFLIWSFFAMFYRIYYVKDIAWSNVNATFLIEKLMNGNMLQVYWFFVPLFCIYLSIPLFAAVREELRKSVFTFISIMGFVFNCLIPFIINFFQINVPMTISVTVVYSYLFYIPIGYLLTHYELKKVWRGFIYIAGIVGFLMHCLGTYILSMRDGAINSTFKGYNNLPAVMYSVAVMVLLRCVGEKLMQKQAIAKIVNCLSKYTFGIYLIHMYILTVLLTEFHIDKTLLSVRLILPFVIVAISVFLIWLIRKLPFGKYILP